MMGNEDCILFEDFVKLLHSISQIRPRRVGTHEIERNTPKVLLLVKEWFTRIREYYHVLPPRTAQFFFRLFFPEEDTRRRYNLQETTLARHLVKDVYGLPIGVHSAGQALMEWSDYPNSTDNAKPGCLGFELERVLERRHTVRQRASPTLQRVDALLDELASLSPYSNLNTVLPRLQRRNRIAILRDLFLDLEPVEAKFMTQIILRDLRPVLYPLHELHTTRALLYYNASATYILTKWDVMRLWHPTMPKIYRTRAILDDAVNAVELLQGKETVHDAFEPVLGVPIEIPKSQKGNRLSHALSFLKGEEEVWAETKYDGERMQIHVDLSKKAKEKIIIFSKSKRDSTHDRMGTHSIIRAALGLPHTPEDNLEYPRLFEQIKSFNNFVKHSVILDAEMVAYSEPKGAIDEFWRIRSLVSSSAEGIRQTCYLKARSGPLFYKLQVTDSQDTASIDTSQEFEGTLQSNGSDNSSRHLMLVFFDVLFLDGENMMDVPYNNRRKLLERIINVIPGYVSVSSRKQITFAKGYGHAIYQLGTVFSDHIANREEGLVLKGASSKYNTLSKPWVKLKRDYIPGFGDTLDLPILGAGWNKERAKKLRVSPETFTTFFVGALTKPMVSGETVSMPRFQILFVVEYGLNREQLEDLNLYVKTWDHSSFQKPKLNLPYEFELPKCLPKPAIMFHQPLLGEFFGAGFTKDAGMKYYCLRFPRLTKVWRRLERSWIDGCSLEEFQTIARKSVGCESSDDWANRTVETIWGNRNTTEVADNVDPISRKWRELLLDLESPRLMKLYGRTPPRSPSSEVGRVIGLVAGREVRVASSQAVAGDVKIIEDGTIEKGEFEAFSVNRGTDSPSRKRKRVSMKENMQAMIPMSSPHTSTEKTRPATNVVPLTLLLTPPRSSMIFDGKKNSGSEFPPVQRICDILASPTAPEIWPKEFIQTPLVQFILDAYIWIHKDEENRRPKNRPPACQIAPSCRRLGVIYFLLMICGCRVKCNGQVYVVDVSQFTHIKKCVIFAKRGEDSETKDALTWLINALESWRPELNRKNAKELFVLDVEMLTYSSLNNLSGNMESFALWRSRKPV